MRPARCQMANGIRLLIVSSVVDNLTGAHPTRVHMIQKKNVSNKQHTYIPGIYHIIHTYIIRRYIYELLCVRTAKIMALPRHQYFVSVQVIFCV